MQADIERMAAAITHRGPDDDGYYVSGRVALGSRRLSIIDLPGGRMPISNEDGSVWIVFNGEIYNYPTLRQMLLERGHQFTTHSDTEVIVHLYEEYGRDCVQHLRGMFAFTLWDEKRQRLLLARDRLGQKPLFYAYDGRTFRFGSEMKAILADPAVPRELNLTSLHHYLTLRFIPAPQTMLCGINKLPPAHTLVLEDGRLDIQRYWDLSFEEKLNLSEEEFLEGLRAKLTETVGAHMISDVPVGAFLSGGMDSSMVVALMAGHLHPFKTFAVGVQEQDFNELPYAKLVAERYATDHIEARVESNLIQLLPQIVWQMDEPSDPIAACMFHAAQIAARHVKVVLGGDGGDELFAGFDRYYGLGRIDTYSRLPQAVRQGLIGPLLARMPESFSYKSLSQKARWLHELAQLPDDAARYAGATAFFRFSHREKEALFSEEWWREVGHIQADDVIIEQYRRAPADEPLDRMLYADFMTRLPEHSLMLTDRMTMAHSLEARSPFLDHELVEYLAKFPAGLKLRGRELKYILRRLGEDYLPPEIVRRDKQGFMFPVAYWFRNELYPLVSGMLKDSHFVQTGLLRPERVNQLVEDHRQNRVDNHVRLWMLLNLDIWHRLYIEEESIPAVRERLLSYL